MKKNICSKDPRTKQMQDLIYKTSADKLARDVLIKIIYIEYKENVNNKKIYEKWKETWLNDNNKNNKFS